MLEQDRASLNRNLGRAEKRSAFCGARLVNGNSCARIDPARTDIAQKDQHQKPELSPVVGAFRFQRHHRTAGIIDGLDAMLGGKVGSQAI